MRILLTGWAANIKQLQPRVYDEDELKCSVVFFWIIRRPDGIERDRARNISRQNTTGDMGITMIPRCRVISLGTVSRNILGPSILQDQNYGPRFPDPGFSRPPCSPDPLVCFDRGSFQVLSWLLTAYIRRSACPYLVLQLKWRHRESSPNRDHG